MRVMCVGGVVVLVLMSSISAATAQAVSVAGPSPRGNSLGRTIRDAAVASIESGRGAEAEPTPAFSRVGVSVSLSTLGVALAAATPVHQRANVRVGVNLFSVNRDFDQEGITYGGALKLRTVETYFDWFPFAGGFHVSPGVVLHNGNEVALTASFPTLAAFTLGDTLYVVNPLNPLSGTGRLSFRSVAPALRLGWGNLIPRGNRRWSVPFEVGVVFQGLPAVSLSLRGSACSTQGLSCQNVATDLRIQGDVLAEQAKIRDDVKFLQYYPVMSVGFSYRF